jgi:hypothetical protein
MDAHMSTKEVGAVDSLKGTLDDVQYGLFCMKDTDYTMKLMSTYVSDSIKRCSSQAQSCRWRAEDFQIHGTL